MLYLMKPYMALLISAIVLSAAMAVSVLKMRPNTGTRSFAVLMSSVALWTFVTVFEVISPDEPTKIFSYSFKYLFIVVVPPAWLSFCLYYANRLYRWRISWLTLLGIIPLITLALVATNQYHGLMFTTLEWYRPAGSLLIYRQFGPWFWVHTAYSYLLIAVGFFYLLKSLLDSPTTYRRQLVTLLIGGLTPWLCNMMFIFNRQPLSHLDLTPFAFSISGAAFLWGVIRYRLLDLVPIAREFITQNLHIGILVVDEVQRILDINLAAARLMPMAPNKLIGRRADQSIPWWSDIDPHQPDTQQILQIKSDGDTHWIRVTKSRLIHNGQTRGLLVVLGNITEIKEAEAALRSSEDRYKSLTENAPILIFALNQNGELTYANPAWPKILGYPLQDVVGRKFSQYVCTSQKQSHGDLFDQIISGKKLSAEIKLELIHCDGSTRIFNLTAAVHSDTEGRVQGIIGLARDITEETELQEQLLMSQKMKAVGTLAGGIAHDFNNLLMGIQANISLMRLETATDSPLMEKLNRVESQIQSGASLTRQLLGYARKGKYGSHTIDIRRLIEDTLHVVERTNKRIRVRQQFSDEPLFMEADRGQIELVLLNLFVNAVDAMPDGGDLDLSASLWDTTRMNIQWPDVETGCYIYIEVKDTGVGMDEKTRSRIFEPFFTTKDIGHGTGLGLASVYGVVKNHRGFIRAESALGKGTTFKILLPASNTIKHAENIPLACREQEVPFDRGGTILIIDDELEILESCGELVKSLGYQAIYAESGDKAVQIYSKHHAEIDFIILDLVMPVLDGMEVYQVLKEMNPDIKVIVSSGYGLDDKTKTILAQGTHLVLTKPYNRNELAAAISQIQAMGLKPTSRRLTLQ